MPLLPRHKEQAAAFRAHRRGRPSVHELRVIDVARLTDDAVALTFEVPETLHEYYRFKHGQHVSIVHPHDGGEIRRSYSICPVAAGQLRLAIRHVPGGLFSRHANEEVRVGDTLRVMTPTGSFTTDVDPSRSRRYVAVAGGSGITPVLSIVTTILEQEPQSVVTLVCANRTRSSTMFFAELVECQADHPGRLTVHHFWSREPAGARRLDRAAIEELLTELPADAVDAWLLCGPSGLLHEVMDALRQRAVAQERIHYELFAAEEEPAQVDEDERPLLDSQVVIRFDEREVALSLSSRGATVLLAALPLIADLPYSCRDGVCATCRAKLVEGEVEMDRCSALDAGERKAGWVLTCQAHPVTARVVLDFDAQA